MRRIQTLLATLALCLALTACGSADALRQENEALRREVETLTAEKYWPFPTYGDLLFGVK